MTFTKKKLAAAIGGTLLASVGIQQAQAVVDIDDTAGAGALLYASEIIIGTSGLSLTDGAGGPGAATQDIEGLMNTNAIQDNTDIRITLTLSSGTFSNMPTLTVVGADGVTDEACPIAPAVTGTCSVPTLFTGGTTADSSVTYNTSTNGNTVNAGSHFLWAIDGITVAGQSAITATVSTQIADSFGPTDLSDNSGTLLSFGPLLALAADDTNADTATNRAIDVAQSSLFFAGSAGDVLANVGGAIVTESTSGQLGTDSAAISATDIIAAAQHTITAASGFAAFAQGTAGAATGITIDGATASVSTADSTIAVGATAAVTPGGDTAGSNDVTLAVTAGNTVAIDQTTLTATVAATGAASAAYSTSTSTGTVSLASLARNGSSARLTFAVNPDSPYPMSIRVTNDSAIDGPVTLTLTNDDGDTSAAVSLADITGVAGDLTSGASTGLIQMADVFAAVQAADATFDLGASSNKLRVSISSLTPTIVLNAFSLSSDGTTFSMVTDAGA